MLFVKYCLQNRKERTCKSFHFIVTVMPKRNKVNRIWNSEGGAGREGKYYYGKYIHESSHHSSYYLSRNTCFMRRVTGQ